MKKPTYKDYLEGTAKVLRQSKHEKEKYNVEVLGRTFIVHPNVFSPKYFLDTAFFAHTLPIQQNENFLEIGPGSGVTSIFAVLRGAKHVTAIDINPAAVANTKENAIIQGVESKMTILQGNLYEPLIKNNQFDTIYWNTPFGYLNQNVNITMLEKAVYDPGYNATYRFISQAKYYLKENGRLLIGFSTTLGKFDMIQKFLKEAGFTVQIISQIQSVETYPVSFEILEARLSNKT